MNIVLLWQHEVRGNCYHKGYNGSKKAHKKPLLKRKRGFKIQLFGSKKDDFAKKAISLKPKIIHTLKRKSIASAHTWQK
jgi:hypothetical protein